MSYLLAFCAPWTFNKLDDISPFFPLIHKYLLSTGCVPVFWLLETEEWMRQGSSCGQQTLKPTETKSFHTWWEHGGNELQMDSQVALLEETTENPPVIHLFKKKKKKPSLRLPVLHSLQNQSSVCFSDITSFQSPPKQQCSSNTRLVLIAPSAFKVLLLCLNGSLFLNIKSEFRYQLPWEDSAYCPI